MAMLRRRSFGGLVGALLLQHAGTGLAQRPAYPTKPIKLIVPFAAGGPSDLLGRLVAQRLGDRLGQAIVVENRGGAGAMIGTSLAAKAPADGYTLLLGVSSAMVFGPLISKQQHFDPLKDFTPISHLVNFPTLLIVHPSVKASNVAELVALANSASGSLNYGSQGNGSTAHLVGERFNRVAGTDIVHVPYKGASLALNDLLAGRIQLMFESATTALPHLKSGGVRAIAVAGKTRFDGLPALPTIAESGYPGFDMSSWNGLLGPAGMPKDVTDRLSAEVAAVFRDPALREKLRTDGIEAVGTNPEAFAAFIGNELKTWEPVVRAVGLYRMV